MAVRDGAVRDGTIGRRLGQGARPRLLPSGTGEFFRRRLVELAGLALFALALWREAGIRVLPGAYMCQSADGEENPGAPYIRIALIYDAAFTEAALRRVVEVL